MSYCRWSSDNWKSDVYVYESDDGFQVHVAAVRYVGEIPPLPNILKVSISEFSEAYKKHHAYLETAKTEKIGGIYDGQSFSYDTLQDLLSGLSNIAQAGYHVPGYVFDTICEEMANGGVLC